MQAKVRSLVDECKALRETLDRFLRAKNARSQADHERAKLFAGATSGSSSVCLSPTRPSALALTRRPLCATGIAKLACRVDVAFVVQSDVG